MTSPKTNTSPVNHNHLAEALKYILYDLDKTTRQQFEKDRDLAKSTGYSSLKIIDWNNAVQVKLIKKAFHDAFSKLTFPFRHNNGRSVTFDIDNAKREAIDKLEPSRIIEVQPKGTGATGYYLILSYSAGDFTTFPNISKEHKSAFEDMKSASTAKLASISSLVPFEKELSDEVKEDIQKIAHELYPQINASQKGTNRQTFPYTDYSAISQDNPGFLQIGDIILMVDPTAMSFTTRNGYQYFPTLRTHGNPAIPTMQQVKDISLNLIFPNEDSINYQLLNIFAMFRRTPFVTIRNIDVVEFFKDIAVDDSYISVALESIMISTIEGFPNTLQAQITLLPFDSKVMSNGLLALKSMGDVLAQQAFIYRDRQLQYLIEKSDRLLQENGVMSSQFDDIIAPQIDSSTNFKESVPFRAFYQSLIEERKFVLDEHGKPDKTDMQNLVDLAPFRPTKDENFLHHYKAEANKIPIGFSYRYVDSDISAAAKTIRKEREEQELAKVEELRNLLSIIKTPEELLENTMLTFYDTSDFYRRYSYEFGEMDNIVKSYLSRHGIGTAGTPVEEITTLFQFLGKTLNSASPTAHLLQFKDQANKLINGEFTQMEDADIVGKLRQVIWNQSFDDKLNTGGSTTTIQQAMESIWNWMNVGDEKDSKSRKGKFLAFLESIGNRMRSNLNSEYGIIFDPGQSDFIPTRLPLKEAKNKDTGKLEAVIDNKNDVLTGWSLQFNNKFTPMHITAYKYPFYQHMGSDDIKLNLNIQSASKGDDLKSKLSLMSDRLYNSAKLVQFTSPELVTYLDSRVTLTTDTGSLLPDGNIFRVFGVQHAVLDSSHSESVQNSPNAWSTTVNMTQANFTIQDYHAIESVNSAVPMRDEIAKLLLRIEKEGDSYKLFKYKSYDNTKFRESIRAIITSKKEEDINTIKNYIEKEKDSLEYTEIQDIKTLNSLSYLYSNQAITLSDHINIIMGTGKKKAAKNIEDVKNQRAYITSQIETLEKTRWSTNAIRDSHYEKTTKKIQELKVEQARLDNIIGLPKEETKKQITGFDSAVTHQDRTPYQKEISDYLNGAIIREIDTIGTGRLNSIIKDYENFKKVLDFNLNIIQQLYSDQTNGMINLINIDEKFWGGVFESIRNSTNFTVSTGVESLTGTGALLILTSVSGGTLSAIGSAFLIAAGLLSIIVQGMLSSSREAAMDIARDKFAQFFDQILQNIRQSTITDLAHKIFKDPIILNKFLACGFLPNTVQGLTYRGLLRTATNCYNDFDFRPFVSANQTEDKIDATQLLRLTPDFYLYNFRLSDAEIRDHHNESMDRFINIGKLTTMTGLIETADAITKFKEIEDSLGLQNAANPIHENVKNIVYNKSNYEDSMNELLDWYKTSVFIDLGGQWKSAENKAAFSKSLSKDDIQTKLAEFDKFNPFPKGIGGLPFIEFSQTPQQRQWREKRTQFEAALQSKTNSIADRDQFSINVLYAARARALIELYTVYISINNYFLTSNAGTAPKKEDNKNKDAPIDQATKFIQSIESISELQKDLLNILNNANKNISGEEAKKFVPDVGKGGNINIKNKVDLPDVVMLKNYLYNKIATYIRLNNAVYEIHTRKDGTLVRDVINSIPSLRFLQYWNVREKEATIHRIETLSDFMRSYTGKTGTTLRMFPTFKVYFIEEDKGIFNQLDDYYTYNAIQSIEITSNKNLASTVARIRLSNVTGTLTDRMNLMREQSDFPMITNPVQNDNVFFGTLDVKPGTSIMIKLGYAANDQDLPTVFVGRIIEMNVGGQVEIIAQSYSAQLNHEILHEKFGMWGTVKGHGDVASAILDTVPGLDKLGKIDPYSIAQGFSGKNINKSKGTFGDRFLLSNLLGSISSIAFAQDNPRDDNIYLPYDLVDAPLHNPTFDWVIYDQSVWEVLQELCLYNRNTRPMMRLYNTDPLATKNDIRQTLVLGDKGGYYKYTDSFAFSSKDYNFIDNKVSEFKNILEKITKMTNFKSLEDVISLNNTTQYDKGSPLDVEQQNIEKLYLDALFNDAFYTDTYKFLCDKTGVLVVALHMMRNTKFDKTTSYTQDLAIMLSTNIPGFSKEQSAAAAIFKMSDACNESDLNNPNFRSIKYKLDLFKQALESIKKMNLPVNFNKEDFYIINPLISNTDESLIYKPNYKKIQNHHLISDDTDILNNNITLSTNFKNAVNLYYPDQPVAANANGLTGSQAKNLNIFRIKALGDTRDEHVRSLNSFQKNIDTDWYEVNREIDGFFKGFKKMQDKGSTSQKIKEYITDGDVKEFNPNSINLDALPAFWGVGLSLLQREVEQMYQGTIEIVGDPTIQPFDIIHINDNINDMHGAVEVEEVTHIFTPEGGYRTVLTPNLICYDRNPVQMQDVSVINNIYDFAKTSRNVSFGFVGGAGLALTTLGIGAATVQQWGLAIGAGAAGIPMLWNGTVGAQTKYRKFLYDQFGEIMGRDCINFSSLIYHNVPFIAGFDGIDYTSLKTLINYKVDEITSPIARIAAFTDPFAAVVSTNWNPENFGLIGAMRNYVSEAAVPGIPLLSTKIKNVSESFGLSPLGINNGIFGR